MKKQTIAVDIDDVLASSAEAFVLYSNKRWGTKLKVEDYTEHWAKLWGVDHEETEKRAQHIYESKMQADFRHHDEAKPILRNLAKHYKLVIITARHRLVQETTIEWLDRHFKGIFSEIHFAGIWDAGHATLQAITLTKAEISKQLGADYLIDDQPKHCMGAADAGVTALLYGDYTWNRNIKLPPDVVRVKNWQEVGKYFNDKDR